MASQTVSKLPPIAENDKLEKEVNHRTIFLLKKSHSGSEFGDRY